MRAVREQSCNVLSLRPYVGTDEMRRDIERLADGAHMRDGNPPGSAPGHPHRGAIDAGKLSQFARASRQFDEHLQGHGNRVPQAPKIVKTVVVPLAPPAGAQSTIMIPMTEFRGDPVLGAKVRHLREERGETQMQVAVDIGVSRGHVGQIEAGRKPVGRSTLIEIARHFDRPVDYFVSAPAKADRKSIDPLIEELEVSARAMPRHQVEALVQMARAFRYPMGANGGESAPAPPTRRSKKGAR